MPHLFPNTRLRPLSGQGIPFIGIALIGCLPAFLKRAYYRLRGARIGKNVSLGMFSYIQSPALVLADGVRIAPFTFIRTRGTCTMGARSVIGAFTAIDTGVFEMGEDAAIGEQVVVGGMLTPRSSLTIGARTKVFSYSFINPTEAITIGDEVCIGGGAYIFTHGTWQSMLDGFLGSFGNVHIQNGVWLAWRCFVMPNVTIGEYATVGAGSVVTRDIPANCLAVGSPAKPIKTDGEHVRTLSDDEKHTLLLGWLVEFASYLIYIGWEATFTATSTGGTIHATAPGGAPCVMVYQQQEGVEVPEADMLLSLKAISPATRAQFARRCGWLDIASHSCGRSNTPLFKELQAFLTRYGVRFG